MTTAGPGGEGCPSDTQLEVTDALGNSLGANDDGPGLGRCSQVSIAVEADALYSARVMAFNNLPLGEVTLVVSQD